MEWISIDKSKPSIGDKVLILTESRPLSPYNYEIFCASVESKDDQIVFKDKWGFHDLFKGQIFFWCNIPEFPERYEILKYKRDKNEFL